MLLYWPLWVFLLLSFPTIIVGHLIVDRITGRHRKPR